MDGFKRIAQESLQSNIIVICPYVLTSEHYLSTFTGFLCFQAMMTLGHIRKVIGTHPATYISLYGTSHDTSLLF